MKEGLFLIAITSPNTIDKEAERISALLENKVVDMVHIRKPNWDVYQTENLISSIEGKWHPKLRLHDHFKLIEKYDLGGIHLNSRNPKPHPCAKTVTRSFHSIEQLTDSEHYDYVTLSPIFDSISKQGYRSVLRLDELKPCLSGRKVVALGGVTPDKFPLLKETGFFGAAMLGHFWI